MKRKNHKKIVLNYLENEKEKTNDELTYEALRRLKVLMETQFKILYDHFNGDKDYAYDNYSTKDVLNKINNWIFLNKHLNTDEESIKISIIQEKYIEILHCINKSSMLC